MSKDLNSAQKRPSTKSSREGELNSVNGPQGSPGCVRKRLSTKYELNSVSGAPNSPGGSDRYYTPGISGRRQYCMGWQLLRAAQNATLGFMSHSRSTDRRKQQPRYENTYHLRTTSLFDMAAAERSMRDILHQNLEFSAYNPLSMRIECKSISAAILERVKAQQSCKRYRYVCVVNIIDTKNNDCCLTSRMLCDQQTDNYVSVTYATKTLTAVATVYAIYLE